MEKDYSLFDNPDYDLKNKNGEYYATYKGSYSSTRYKKTESITKFYIKKWKKKKVWVEKVALKNCTESKNCYYAMGIYITKV